jgi:hypothetical protein
MPGTSGHRSKLFAILAEEEAMPVLILRSTPVMRFAVAIVALTAVVPVAQADPSTQTRVIGITKENAERSAAAIAAAKSPFIGMPPPGRVIRTVSDWRNSRADLSDNEANGARKDDQAKIVGVDNAARVKFPERGSDRVQVQVIKPGKAGTIVETTVVPRDHARGL